MYTVYITQCETGSCPLKYVNRISFSTDEFRSRDFSYNIYVLLVYIWYQNTSLITHSLTASSSEANKMSASHVQTSFAYRLATRTLMRVRARVVAERNA